MSVIGIQAAAARRVIDRDPEAAATALGGIERSSREAVAQMRSLLGTLRDLGEEGAERDGRAPEPGVSDLPALAAERTASGLVTAYDQVESSPGAAQQLPGPLGLSLYRVAQEALANTTKHSTARSARIVLRVEDRTASPYAEVEVLDDGRPRGATSGSGLGHLGMSERAAGMRGEVEIGPAPHRWLPGARAGAARGGPCLSPPTTLRVLIVDDQQLVRSGFRMMLSVEPDLEVVGEADNGATALEQARALHPDVVLMDVQMPVMDGIEATRALVAEDLGRVLILTTFDRDDYVFDGLQAGASGFLLKNAEPEQLVDAVRAVGHGHALLAPEVTRRVIARMTAGPGARPGSAPGRRRGRADRSRVPAAAAPASTPGPTGWRDSPTASARCSCSWRGACPTARSRRTSSSARPP